MARRLSSFIFFTWAILSASLRADDTFTRTTDLIYGRKFGVALTMDVFTPRENPNGAAIIWVVSGGWHSSHEAIAPDSGYAPIKELTKHGYVVFAVVHGSNPKFSIPEVLEDMNRATRFIRFHAADYKFDPQRLGITGASAGGHLSLMQGNAGDAGDSKSKDPVDQTSSRVQAVACFFPPTDFLNYGKPGENAIGRGILKDYKAAFAFTKFDDATKAFVPITDETEIEAIGRRISPIYAVTKDSPPTLIFHGDADHLVPIQQSESILKKLKDAGVPCELVVKPGEAHGWKDLDKDWPKIADWFDKYLAKQK